MTCTCLWASWVLVDRLAQCFTGCLINMVDKSFCTKCTVPQLSDWFDQLLLTFLWTWGCYYTYLLYFSHVNPRSVARMWHWHKDRNEPLRNVVWQVNSAQFPCHLALYPFPPSSSFMLSSSPWGDALLSSGSVSQSELISLKKITRLRTATGLTATEKPLKRFPFSSSCEGFPCSVCPRGIERLLPPHSWDIKTLKFERGVAQSAEKWSYVLTHAACDTHIVGW